MSRHWVIKKDRGWLWVIVYSVVGMSILMGLITFVAMSATK
jgi:hypothetical protein